MCSRQEYRPLQGQYPNWIIYFAPHKLSQSGFDSWRTVPRTVLQEQNKKTPKGALFLCSRQESNLERWYRKPAFYPLNYESIWTEKSGWLSVPQHHTLKSKFFQQFEQEGFFEEFFFKLSKHNIFNIINIFFWEREDNERSKSSFWKN